MTQEQKRRLEDTKIWIKGEGSIGHQWAVCPEVKDRKIDEAFT